MGVKSTTSLTRHRAIELAKSMYARSINAELDRYFGTMSDKELEDWLEDTNDEIYRQRDGMTGFDNYLIVPEDEADLK